MWLTIFTGALAIVGIIQGVLIRDQIRLGQREFNATHRPKIILRGFRIQNRDLPTGKRIGYVFIAHNAGDSSGRLIECRSATIVLAEKERLPGNLSFPFAEKLELTLDSGEHEVVPGNGGNKIEGNEAMEIFAGQRVLICLGTVTYLDGNGVRRVTGFCRQYRPREDEWDTRQGSEYEYTY